MYVVAVFLTLLIIKKEEGLNTEEGGANGEEWTAEEKTRGAGTENESRNWFKNGVRKQEKSLRKQEVMRIQKRWEDGGKNGNQKWREKENLRTGDRKQETGREQEDSRFMLAQRNHLKFEYQMKDS